MKAVKRVEFREIREFLNRYSSESADHSLTLRMNDPALEELKRLIDKEELAAYIGKIGFLALLEKDEVKRQKLLNKIGKWVVKYTYKYGDSLGGLGKDLSMVARSRL